MKVVLDTNVWVSAAFWRGDSYRIVSLAERGKLEIFISKAIVAELIHVLDREDKFKTLMKKHNQSTSELIRTILSISEMVQPTTSLDIIKDDPSDNRILECAVEAKANYLISQDNHLLEIKEYEKIKIVHPKEFIGSFKNL